MNFSSRISSSGKPRRFATRASGPTAQSGVALVVTLILLSIITFMAIAFLVLSHREQSSVVTQTDQLLARLATETGLERAQAEMLVGILNSTNAYNIGLHVSANFINPYGFVPGLASPTNVNFAYTHSGAALSAADQLQNVANLQFSPRVPVYIVTNRTLGSNEFRYYLDLNRDGRFEPTGVLVVTNGLGQPVTINNNVFLTDNVVGDPQWVAELEFPDRPHSADNRFIYRYAYTVIPASETLDINYIHNQAANPAKQAINLATGADYRRNQGVGTWEINLASFLHDLNTNLYGWGGVYVYNPLIPSVIGNSFFDACGILANRYGNVNVASALGSVATLFPGGGSALGRDDIDCYTAAPIMTNTVSYRFDPDLSILTRPWPGADNTNHIFTPQDFFNPNRTSPDFVARLSAVSTNIDTYDRYTYYRLLSQLGTDSSPEPANKMNLNYDNLVLTNRNGIVSETNLFAWEPVAFFTNAAARLLADASYTFSVTNIQVWPTNFYTPSVHRMLQLAANIYDSTGNRTNNGVLGCPSVFRPIFRHIPPNPAAPRGEVVIAGYREVRDAVQQAAWTVPGAAPYYYDLDVNTNDFSKFPIYGTPAPPNGPERQEPMLLGVPLVIGAKKGFPNFNEFAMQTFIYVSRLLEFRRKNNDPNGPVNETNQMYVVAITNAFGLEAWNSYFTNYPRNLRLIASVDMLETLTNLDNLQMVHTNMVSRGAIMDIPSTGLQNWPGWTNVSDVSSFKLPWGRTNGAYFLPNSTYRAQPIPNGQFVPQTHIFEAGTGFYVPRWLFTLSARLRFILYDQQAQRIVDYVNVKNTEASIDLMAKLSEGANCGSAGPQTYNDPAAQWCITRAGGSLTAPTYGILNQIGVGLNGMENWNSFSVDPYAGNDAHKAVDGFRYNLRGWSPIYPENQGLAFFKSNVFYAPFDPYRPIYIHTTWQANDPLVHYTMGDLIDLNIDPTNRVNFVSGNPPLENIGAINNRFEPWGGSLTGRSNPDIGVNDIAAKDPQITRPDYWDFPTNKFPNPGWIGRVHRGTPWQTVFLKSTNVLQSATAGLKGWQKWTGNLVYNTNYGQISTSLLQISNWMADAVFSLPTNDWRLMDLFTTAINDNSTRGQLSVNQTNLAAWSAVLAGVNVLKNANNSTFIEPAGLYDPINPTPLARIVNGINFTRTKFPNGSFQRKGDILATPELTVASPYISSVGGGIINDAVVERIPQQIMGLLRGGEDPRFMIYCWGQALKPAPRSIVPSGPFTGLCTNYTITAEVATRAVVRVVGAPNSPHTVVESFNVLPPE
jgi:hypothetical protein